jgi:hypothetical protein
MPVARKWMTVEPNEPYQAFLARRFQAFLASTDLLITSLPNDPIFDTLPTAAIRICTPPFSFWGQHPDSFDPLGPQIPSVLKDCHLQSRITLTAFIMGKPWKEAMAAFNGEVYERLGYFAAYESVSVREECESFESVTSGHLSGSNRV